MSGTHGDVRIPIDRYGFLHAPEGRRLRGRRISRALSEFGAVEMTDAAILDIGCSTGLITEEIAQRARLVVGVDVDTASLAYAICQGGRARFVAASGARLPFADGSFDAVVCNHVYEHVPDAAALMRDVHRVLRFDGVCYFAAGHTLQLIEPHYRVPFLSWLPRPLAGLVLRATGKGNGYDERFLPPWRLRELFAPYARAEFISPRMLRAPEQFEFQAVARLPAIARPVLALLSDVVARLAPTWIYLLRK